MTKFNPRDKESIFNYAQNLKGKSFRDVYDESNSLGKTRLAREEVDSFGVPYEDKSRKGGLGELIEERYFHYRIDNQTKADFEEAEVELKVTPFKVNKNGTVSAKERLIISMINYMKIVNMEFFTSNAWEKLKNLLLIYYLWEPQVEDRLDYIIHFIYMFSPVGEDLEIIKKDFYKIKQKVLDGKAHELSEGDTMYLGAATKSATSRNRTQQPNSNVPAKPRAFSLKTSYMTYVLRNHIVGSAASEDKILVGTSEKEFEKYVLDEIYKFKNMRDSDLFLKFFSEPNLKGKDKYSRLALRILGVKTKNAEEFAKANIVVKAIRIDRNNKIRESMSFPTFKIMELIEQDWEESDVYNYFSETRFLFVVYKESDRHFYLKGAKFWHMPTSDIEGSLRFEWERAVKIFKQGVEFIVKGPKHPVKNNLPKKSNTRILHVRPHATKSAYLINGVKYGNGEIERDTDLLPNGDRMTKQCFWLNNDYVRKHIEEILKIV